MQSNQPLTQYLVSWDSNDLPITTVVKKLQAKQYPDTLTVAHPLYGTVNLEKQSGTNEYVASRQSVVGRSYGNVVLEKEELLEYLLKVFTDLAKNLGDENKLLNNTSKAKAERNKNPPAPKSAAAGSGAAGSGLIPWGAPGGKRRKTHRKRKGRKGSRKH